MSRQPFAVQSARSDSTPISVERLINFYPRIEGDRAKGKLTLRGTPGLKAFASAGSGPIRGTHNMLGVAYFVSGPDLYTVSSTGNATLIGGVGSAGNVTMSDNGAQLTIISGTAGYTYTVATDTLAVISDADFPAASSVTFLDLYTIVGKDSSGEFYISTALDSTEWDALDFATAEALPDNIVRVYANKGQLWLFGEDSTEVWFNSGASFPFTRMSGGRIDRGCLAKLSVAEEDNSLFWLGNDKTVYRANGFTPQRISTHAVEEAIESYATPQDGEAWTYTMAGHKFYALSFSEGTWVYDIATGLWHERQSTDKKRWRASAGIEVYGKVLCGDFETGNIYELDADTYDENGADLIATAISEPFYGEGQYVRMPRLQLEFETGVGLTTGQGSDPQVMLQFTDDGGKTWSNEKWRSLGKIGKYKSRVVWNRLGAFKERSLKISISDPVKRVLIAADIRLK
jgi:hypothetical protein